ncbi:FecR family protein [Filimonas lacunae]|uniref:FecR family protein n=1 Tax=Filimonas lacunae TaxID=477680 RepID=A0A173MRR9_9BACT|nr:FecR family protein [Filimonas lacunae]BAV10038.1 anti-sigma factor [Filimonas lacunae]SIS82995.1 FecR family protein [Filimonas lacunae]
MDRTRIEYLLGRLSAGKLNEEEMEELNQLVSGKQRADFEAHVAEMMAAEDRGAALTDNVLYDTVFEKIMQADKPARVVKASFFRRNQRWLSAAAVFLFLVGGTYLFFGHNGVKSPTASVTLKKPEKEPGRNTAILTLADNSTVDLGSNGDRVIGNQGGAQVLMKDGKLAYKQNAAGAAVAYNSITTPRGGEFFITLSDGTRLWMNASSVIRFPTAFTGATRVVELEGEAYFEVAEDKAHPFEVKMGDRSVQVLGTAFNVMAYSDEASMITTLVEGAVKVSSADRSSKILNPGQHAVIHHQAPGIEVETADVEEETAWKNGRTYFNGADVAQIMRQVSRWYNVDVRYEGEVRQLKFTCTVSRKDKLSKLLQLLEMTGTVHFSMEGNVIVVRS